MSYTKKKDKIEKKKTNDRLKHDNLNREIFEIFPILLLVIFLPFMIRLKIIPLEGYFYDFWIGERYNADFFTYFKQIFIYIITGWSILNTFLFTKDIKANKLYYFAGAYAVLVILSTLFSEYFSIALNGFNERREGMWIVLCYLLLLISAMNLIKKERQVRIIMYGLATSGMIISIISIFQYYGFDIFSSDLGKKIIISQQILNQLDKVVIKFGEKNSYGVFYNPNYLGHYISFYAPLMLSYAIISKDAREKLLFVLFFILSIFALFGSRSEAGVLGIAVATGFLILVLTTRYIIKDKPKEEHKKLLLTRFAPIVLAMIILPASLSYVTIEQNPLTKIKTQAIEFFKPSELKGRDYKEIGPINDIKQIDNNSIEIVVQNNSNTIKIDDNSIVSILDKDNNVLWKNNIKKLEEKNYKIEKNDKYDSRILVKKTSDINKYGIRYYIRTHSCFLYFVVDDGNINIANSKYQVLDLEKDFSVAENIGFEGKGKLASGRGYIWSRSLPIMFDNIIIGTGQDTFVTEFPQYDIYGKQVELSLNNLWTLTDKPHNTYLQIGIHSGLLSLIIVLGGLLILLYKSFKNVIFDDEYLYFNIISFGILGFMISSIFNDSIIAITPIVYIFIGINIVGLIKTKNKKADS